MQKCLPRQENLNGEATFSITTLLTKYVYIISQNRRQCFALSQAFTAWWYFGKHTINFYIMKSAASTLNISTLLRHLRLRADLSCLWPLFMRVLWPTLLQWHTCTKHNRTHLPCTVVQQEFHKGRSPSSSPF